MAPRVNKSPFHARVSLLMSLCFLLTIGIAYAGDPNGEQGINDATTLVKTYFKAATTLLYAIGGIVGLVGAIRVYNKWSSGDPDTSKAAASWFGACIFLVVVASLLTSFFGL